MNDKKQIEELASLMADCNTTCDECFEKFERVMALSIQKRENYCQAYAYAKKAVEQGYCKILKGAVVLTKEECDNKVILNEDHFERALNYEREKARKETASEILAEIQTEIFHCLGVKNIKETDKLSLLGSLITYDLITDKLYELSKQYGVEIGE